MLQMLNYNHSQLSPCEAIHKGSLEALLRGGYFFPNLLDRHAQGCILLPVNCFSKLACALPLAFLIGEKPHFPAVGLVCLFLRSLSSLGLPEIHNGLP